MTAIAPTRHFSARIGSALIVLSSAAFAQQPTLERFVFSGSDITYARGIDAQGRVVGSHSSTGGKHGYLRDANGAMTTVDWPGASITSFEGMSEGGVAVAYVVGGAGIPGPAEYTNGGWSALQALPFSTSFLQGANDAGVRVGYLVGTDASHHGLLYVNDTPLVFDFPGAHATELADVDAQGRILGNYRPDDVSPWRGFLHDPLAGTWRDIERPGFAEMRVRGMNDLGDIVGEVLPMGGGQRRAALFSDGQWSDLELFGVLGESRAADVANDGRICGDYYGRFRGADAVLGFLLDPNGDGPATFCDSTVNSSGSAAQIHFAGSTSIAANDLELEAGPAPANTPGVFFYGSSTTLTPFGDGFLCVGTPHQRVGPAPTDPSGFAWRPFDANEPHAALGPVTAGSTWYFQYWFRDPAAGGAGFNTSRALEVEFTP
ncbi:MAG: hypothetical protein H6831_03640 [Planctomycetes bacterium]|nr:hypothetical protein [Planctomycetota bacterium]MCB9903478.1 hypothetical protein [Planctomycetota bacterium]